MAPYISSHLRDKVRSVPLLPGTHLDILQNLVANTRTNRSAAAQAPASPRAGGCPGGGLCPADMKTSARKGSVLCVDSGWNPLEGTVMLAEWNVASVTTYRLITRTSDLSAWIVV